MKQTGIIHPNQPHKTDPTYFIALLILGYIAIWAFSMMLSCNPQKKIDRSVMIVKSDSGAMEQMRAVVNRIWPCIPAIGKPGQPVIVINTVKDTAQTNAFKKKLDSLLNIVQLTPAFDKDSVTNAIRQQLWDQFSPAITTIHESRVDTIPDTRAIQAMQERLDAQKQISSQQQGQIIEKDKQAIAFRKTADKWRLYAFLTWGILAIIFGIGIYLKFFTPAGGATSILKKLN